MIKVITGLRRSEEIISIKICLLRTKVLTKNEGAKTVYATAYLPLVHDVRKEQEKNP